MLYSTYLSTYWYYYVVLRHCSTKYIFLISSTELSKAEHPLPDIVSILSSPIASRHSSYKLQYLHIPVSITIFKKSSKEIICVFLNLFILSIVALINCLYTYGATIVYTMAQDLDSIPLWYLNKYLCEIPMRYTVEAYECIAPITLCKYTQNN